MPVTRSQTQVLQHRAGQTGRGRGRGRAQLPPLNLDPVPGHAGLHYDIRHLSPNSAQTVVEGLRSTLEVEVIEPFENGRDRYYAFRIKKPIAVRIYNPAGNRTLQDRVECACQAYQRTRRACKHLYWLFGRFHAVLRRDQQVGTWQQGSREIEVTSHLTLNNADADDDDDDDDDDEDDDSDESDAEEMRA